MTLAKKIKNLSPARMGLKLLKSSPLLYCPIWGLHMMGCVLLLRLRESCHQTRLCWPYTGLISCNNASLSSHVQIIWSIVMRCIDGGSSDLCQISFLFANYVKMIRRPIRSFIPGVGSLAKRVKIVCQELPGGIACWSSQCIAIVRQLHLWYAVGNNWRLLHPVNTTVWASS